MAGSEWGSGPSSPSVQLSQLGHLTALTPSPSIPSHRMRSVEHTTRHSQERQKRRKLDIFLVPHGELTNWLRKFLKPLLLTAGRQQLLLENGVAPELWLFLKRLFGVGVGGEA